MSSEQNSGKQSFVSMLNLKTFVPAATPLLGRDLPGTEDLRSADQSPDML